MKGKSVVLNLSDFKYPTKDERKLAFQNMPKLKSFDFPNQDAIELIIRDNVDPRLASRIENIVWWDNGLKNLLGKLREAYLIAITSYNRGFSDELSENSTPQHLNRFMFDFYAEVFYYFLVSSRDTIFQILNELYGIGFEEGKVEYKNKFKKEVEKYDVAPLLQAFMDHKFIENAIKYRNAFTHRFNPRQNDHRSKVEQNVYQMGRGQKIDSETMVSNMKEVLKLLSNLLNELKPIFELKYSKLLPK